MYRVMSGGAPLVLGFGEIGSDALAVVGGKGANLAWMARAGLPVPPGFCVTTEAFKRFVGPDIEPLYAALEALDAGDVEATRVTAARVRDALRALPVPPEVAAAVVRGVARALRSRPRVGRPLERHRRGPAGRVLRGAAGYVPERPRRGRAASTRSATAGCRSSPTARSCTARGTAFHIGRWRCRWSSSAWSLPTRRASSSPRIRSAAAAPSRRSTRASASARRWWAG